MYFSLSFPRVKSMLQTSPEDSQAIWKHSSKSTRKQCYCKSVSGQKHTVPQIFRDMVIDKYRADIIFIMLRKRKKRQTWIPNNLPGSPWAPHKALIHSLFRFSVLSGRLSDQQQRRPLSSLPIPGLHITPVIFHQGFWRERKPYLFWHPFPLF